MFNIRSDVRSTPNIQYMHVNICNLILILILMSVQYQILIQIIHVWGTGSWEYPAEERRLITLVWILKCEIYLRIALSILLFKVLSLSCHPINIPFTQSFEKTNVTGCFLLLTAFFELSVDLIEWNNIFCTFYCFADMFPS